MISDSPHLYLRDGLAAGVSSELLATAIQRAYATERHGLRAVLTLNHLAHQSGADHGYLRDVVGRSVDPYTGFLLRGKRQISSPRPPMRAVQRWILRNILSQVSCHPASFAYERHKSIAQCARRHVGASWLIKLDLHDFFSSIDERQVFAVFSGLGYGRLVSFEMSRLCTRQGIGAPYKLSRTEFISSDRYPAIWKYRTSRGLGYLPQGSPTSGALANLVMRDIDVKISEATAGTGIVYTRYADDIAFSTSGPFSRQEASDLILMTDKLLRHSGFMRHENKTRVIPPGARKIVLGLLVDGDRVRIPRDARRRLLNDIRGAEKFGLPNHTQHRGFSSVIAFGERVAGMLAYCHDVDPEWTAPLWGRWMRVLVEHNVPIKFARREGLGGAL
ncbi:reverse transcriptase family protein [Actinomadura luteofluorescens]|uniref:reverse transcriptase family protein n=1 Tax=Actinomadura luteofluorescens TaxID=46163 RepID=UPI00347CCA2A